MGDSPRRSFVSSKPSIWTLNLNGPAPATSHVTLISLYVHGNPAATKVPATATAAATKQMRRCREEILQSLSSCWSLFLFCSIFFCERTILFSAPGKKAINLYVCISFVAIHGGTIRLDSNRSSTASRVTSYLAYTE